MSNTRKTHGMSGNPARREQQAHPGPVAAPNGHPVPAPHPSPPVIPAEVLQAVAGQLNALIQQNVADFRALQQRGIGFDQNQITNARIDSVIGAIAQALGPQGQLWELQCRLGFEQHMAEQIEKAKTEGTKAQLAQGSLLSPESIRTLARETGTYGGH